MLLCFCVGLQAMAGGAEGWRLKLGGGRREADGETIRRRTLVEGENACCLGYFYKGLYVQNLYTFRLRGSSQSEGFEKVNNLMHVFVSVCVCVSVST